MARYIGQNQRLLESSENLFSGQTRPLKKEITLPANTETTEGEAKNPNTQFSCLKSKKQNTPMVF